MEHNRIVEIPEGFLSDLIELSGTTVKCYLVLKELADIARLKGKLDEDGTARIYCSYEYIRKEAKLSKPVIRKALIELAKRGWICGFKRGNNGGIHKDAERTSNEYSIPFERRMNKDEFYKMVIWKRGKNG